MNDDRLPRFRWRDALDILLVAILIYRVLTLFRGTRAVQITIGLAVLAGAALLARTLESARAWAGCSTTSGRSGSWR